MKLSAKVNAGKWQHVQHFLICVADNKPHNIDSCLLLEITDKFINTINVEFVAGKILKRLKIDAIYYQMFIKLGAANLNFAPTIDDYTALILKDVMQQFQNDLEKQLRMKYKLGI